jgi:dTDP-4-dehydrorhamnose 3,5-epimerase
MDKWSFKELHMKGAYEIAPFYSGDIRGGFVKDYSREIFEQNNIFYKLEEVFYTISHTLDIIWSI